MSFSQIIGQQLPIKILKQSLKKDRVANAYLFYGPAGIGKKLTALNLAKLVNCLQPTDEPCDECHSCRRIENFNHPDVSVVVKDPAATALKIEQIRELEENIYLKPFEGKMKVFIIEEAADMTEEAQNALLKTLEEPPADSILVLLTSNEQNLLETIRSRCLRLRFNRLTTEQIRQIILKQYDLEENQALVLARISEGSLEKANHAEEYLNNRERLIEKILSGFFRLGQDEEWLDLTRDEARQVLEFTSGWCRDALLIKLGVHEKNLLLNPDYSQQLEDFSSAYDTDHLLEIVEQIHRTIDLINANVNIRLALEVLWDNV